MQITAEAERRLIFLVYDTGAATSSEAQEEVLNGYLAQAADLYYGLTPCEVSIVTEEQRKFE